MEQKTVKNDFWTLLRPNFSTLIVFEMIYSAVGGLIIIPLLYWLFRGALSLSGMAYIAPHNVGDFVTSPAFWIVVIIALLLAAFYSVVSINGVIFTCECSRQKKKVALGSLIRHALVFSKPVFKPKNWEVILLVLVVIPLMNIGITPAFLGAITIPDFILEFISYKKIFIAISVIVCLFFIALILRWMYAFNYMALEEVTFKEACKRSARLGKGHYFRDLISIILTQFIVFTVAMLVLTLLTLFFTVLFKLLFQLSGVASAILSVGMSLIYIFLIILTVIILTLGMPLCYAVISAKYYQYRKYSGYPISDVVLEISDERRPQKKVRILTGITVILIIGVLSVLFYNYSNGDIKEKISAEDIKEVAETEHSTGVVAHRCGAHFAPENTIAALNKVADMGATWCEIDVQQCKDGSIIVMHDTNFERTTGKDADSWTMTLEEVKQLDAGSSFSEEYAGEKIPTLDEMIKAAKARGISLQIEMKPTGNEYDFEKKVADVIVANDYVQNCLIASQDYKCLETAHQYNPNIRTLYITWIAFGDVTKIEAAADFSVESTWISNALVETVHESGNQIFAWTVNTPSVMQRMIDCGIDALVTDEIEEAMKITKENSTQFFADYIIDFFDISKKEGDV